MHASTRLACRDLAADLHASARSEVGKRPLFSPSKQQLERAQLHTHCSLTNKQLTHPLPPRTTFTPPLSPTSHRLLLAQRVLAKQRIDVTRPISSSAPRPLRDSCRLSSHFHSPTLSIHTTDPDTPPSEPITITQLHHSYPYPHSYPPPHSDRTLQHTHRPAKSARKHTVAA
jgi:hypothetical protein